MKDAVSVFYRRVVGFFFWSFVSLLAVLAAVSTGWITLTEHALFLQDAVWANLAAAAVIAGLFILGRRFLRVRDEQAEELLFRRVRRVLLAVIGVMSCVFVLSTQTQPVADQLQVQLAAHAFRFQDYSSLKGGGYLAMYQNQLGLVWFTVLLSYVFGSSNSIGFMLLNAAFVPLLWGSLAALGGQMGLSRRGQLAVIGCGVLFVPVIMYSGFVYGTVISLTLAVLAMLAARRFTDGGGKRYAFFAAALILLSVWIKNNSLIFLVALVIDALMRLLQKRRVRQLLLCGLLAVTIPLTQAPVWFTQAVTGVTLGEGNSTWAWIAMGISENSDESEYSRNSLNDGWYNAFSEISYATSAYDPVIQTEQAKELISQRLSEFAADPAYALRFFLRKTASQWNDPDFQSWYIHQNTTQKQSSDWSVALLSVRGQEAGNAFLNLLQFVTLFGALLWWLLGSAEDRDRSLVPAMTFVGGFLFHLFWEAKCQYTLPYFLLLFPMAVGGYTRLADGVCGVRTTDRRPWIRRGIALGGLAAVIAAFAFGGAAWVTGDEYEYQDYLESTNLNSALADGTYFLCSYSDIALDRAEDGTFYLNEDLDYDGGVRIQVYTSQGVTVLREASTGMYLAFSDADANGYRCLITVTDFSYAATFRIEEALGGYVLFRSDGDAISWMDEGWVVVRPFEDNEYFAWYAEKVEQ